MRNIYVLFNQLTKKSLKRIPHKHKYQFVVILTTDKL